MNQELEDVKTVFRKGRGTRDQIANIHPLDHRKSKRIPTKTSASLTTKAFDCEDHNKLCKILKEMGIPDHLTCLLRNLYVGQEATVRTGHGTTDWFQTGTGVCQGCILPPCLFNLFAEYRGPSSQSYGFSSSHVWMWVGLQRKLSTKELMLLNCGVGEDSWESLDCKEIQPVHPKGNQSWIFIGRTDAEAEAPILWPPNERTDSFEKTLMLGKIEVGKRRGWQKVRWLNFNI